jgi:hypothetical protein
MLNTLLQDAFIIRYVAWDMFILAKIWLSKGSCMDLNFRTCNYLRSVCATIKGSYFS